jgi:hypothetical protein
MIWKIGGLGMFCLVLYLGTMFYSKDKGEALEKSSATKIELKELESDVERNRESINGIDKKLVGIEIKQEMHTIQMARAIGILEKMAVQKSAN